MLDFNSKGYVKNRESQCLEFKQSFQLGDSLYTYARTMVGMANNQGGRIVFGIKDCPHVPVGLINDKFQNCDPKNINRILLDSFSSDLQWRAYTIELNNTTLGVIEVSEAQIKPILCTRNHSKSKLRESTDFIQTATTAYNAFKRLKG